MINTFYPTVVGAMARWPSVFIQAARTLPPAGLPDETALNTNRAKRMGKAAKASRKSTFSKHVTMEWTACRNYATERLQNAKTQYRVVAPDREVLCRKNTNTGTNIGTVLVLQPFEFGFVCGCLR